MRRGPVRDSLLFVRARNSDPALLQQFFLAELPVLELAQVLHAAAWKLLTDWSDRSGES